MRKETALKFLGPLLLVVLWQVSVPFLNDDLRYLFPAPTDILAQLAETSQGGALLANFWITIKRVLTCVILGGTLGAATGLLMGVSKVANVALDGIVAFLMPVPKIAVFPLFLVIFGFGETARLIPIATSAYFPLLIAGRTAAQSIDPHLVDVCRTYQIRGWMWFRRFLLPSCAPMLLSGLRLATTMALIVSVAVEMLASNSGIGSILWLGWQTMRMEQIFGAVFLIGLFGIVVSGLIGLVENRYARVGHDR